MTFDDIGKINIGHYKDDLLTAGKWININRRGEFEIGEMYFVDK